MEILALGVRNLAFYSPRGLKIRFDVQYAFSLLARLYPKRSPEAVLATAEALVDLPGSHWNALFLLALLSGARPWAVIGFSVLGSIWGTAVVELGLFIIPGAVTLAGIWSRIPWLVRVLGVPILATVVGGWTALVAWVGAYVLAGSVHYVVSHLFTRWRQKGTGLIATFSETAFLNAFRLHASSLGVSTDIVLSDKEADGIDWSLVAGHYAANYPGQIPGV